jgi:type VI secretion system protein ImpK
MTSPLSTNIRSLPVAFRDTALTVATLHGHATSDSFETLRRRCREQVRRLREELKAHGQPDDVIQDALYAQCALLDEAALSHLHGSDRDAWEREPLQVAEFGTHDAGDALIERVQQRLHQPQPVRSLLAIFYAVLALGFKGRFALEGCDARATMIRALGDRLGVFEGSPGGVVVSLTTRRRGFAHVSLLACVLLSITMAGLVWMLLDRWLRAAAAQLLQ